MELLRIGKFYAQKKTERCKNEATEFEYQFLPV